MNYLPELMNCLRPDDLQENMEAMLKAQQQDQEDENSCDYCKSYNDEKPTTRFVMKDLIAGTVEVVDLCNDCINEDAIFLNKRIIDVTIL